MPENLVEDPSKHSGSLGSVVGAVARVYWMILGNCVLYIIALAITRRTATWTVDKLFWLIVASLVLVRYLDVHVLGGLTACGRRASLQDCQGYNRTLLLVSLALWIVSHAVALTEIW